MYNLNLCPKSVKNHKNFWSNKIIIFQISYIFLLLSIFSHFCDIYLFFNFCHEFFTFFVPNFTVFSFIFFLPILIIFYVKLCHHKSRIFHRTEFFLRNLGRNRRSHFCSLAKKSLTLGKSNTFFNNERPCSCLL